MTIWLAALSTMLPEAAEVPHCSPANAERTTVGDIKRRPDRFRGRCVTVQGPVDPISIYASEGARARSRRLLRLRGTPTEPDTRQRLGVYSGNASSGQHGPEGRWAITGIVDDCESMYERALARSKREAASPPEEEGAVPMIMMSGYCHYLPGEVIHAVAVERLPERSR